jgi:hypothetical protein
MNDKVRRRLEMLFRVERFGRTYATSFPPDSRGDELFTTVRQAIATIEAHTTMQAASAQAAKQQTGAKADVRDRLIEEMEAISMTARAMAPRVPGLEDKFRMPRKAGQQELLVAARIFARDAVALKTEFTRRALPESFIDDLNALIEEFSGSIGEHDQHSGARVAAGEATAVALEQAMEAVRELDAVVRNRRRGDRAALAEWQSTSHIERAPQRAPDEPPPATSKEPAKEA